MKRSSQLLLGLAFLGLWASKGGAQPSSPPAPTPTPVPAPASEGPSTFLQELPRRPDAPASMMQAAPLQEQSGAAAETPYFQLDPLLDPAEMPQPGWFTAAEMQLTKPHVTDSLVPETPLAVPGVGTVNVTVASVPINWTVAPKLTLGYRLPSGFGEFLVSYRFFNAQGTSFIPFGTTGLTGVSGSESSRLSMNQFDFDYSSREYTPYARWGMRWWVGLRLTDYFYRSSAFQPGVAPGGIDSVQASDFTMGVGAHAGVQLERRFGDSGLQLVNKLDIADSFAKEDQSFAAGASALGTGAANVFFRSTNVPYINWQLGLGWQPPSLPNAHFFMGSQMECWWNIGKDANFLSNMSLYNYGIVWQAAFNF